MSRKWAWLDDAQKLEALEAVIEKLSDATSKVQYLEEHTAMCGETATAYGKALYPALATLNGVLFDLEKLRDEQARKQRKEV